MKILILNGPNLNLLGLREPDVYGRTTLEDVEEDLRSIHAGVELDFFQSNDEGVLIDRLHATRRDGTDAVVFNPGGYSHTSVALRDAIASIDIPVIEVHISNTLARESFRHLSVTAGACRGQITGLGTRGYDLAIRYFVGEPGPA